MGDVSAQSLSTAHHPINRYTPDVRENDHYQRAFEVYVRAERLPYVSVDEARRAILPGRANNGPAAAAAATLKSFDFVVYGSGGNLLVEVKGRKVARRRRVSAGTGASDEQRGRAGAPGGQLRGPGRTRLETWVTRDDVESLRVWEGLFGEGFTAVFAFVYWCEELPPGALFEEYVEHEGRSYAIRCIGRADYERCMRPRSPRWGTVHLTPDSFDRLSRPLAGRIAAG